MNNCTITNTKTSHRGGIAGGVINSAQINNCTNNATIKGASYVGGIAGGIDDRSRINNCTNTNNATVKGSYNVGGIVGYDRNKSVTTNCKNFGSVSADGWVSDEALKVCRAGGISGCSVNGSTITGCENTGTVTAYYSTGLNYPLVGGIVGWTDGEVSMCKNSGTVQTQNFTSTMSGGGLGGIAGVSKKGNIEECYNTGTVHDTSKKAIGLGGIVGEGYTVNIYNCYNTGSITGGAGVGGIAGGLWRKDSGTRSEVRNSYNSQTSISGTSYVGNFVGYAEYSYFDYCGYIGSQPIGKYSNISVRNTFITRDSKFKFRCKK